MSYAVFVVRISTPNKRFVDALGIRVLLSSSPESEFSDTGSPREFEGWIDGRHQVTCRQSAGTDLIAGMAYEQLVKFSMANCRSFEIKGWPYDDRHPRWILPDPGKQARSQNGIIDLAISSPVESSGVIMGYLGQSIMYNFIAPGFVPPPTQSDWDIAASALVTEGDLIPFVVYGEGQRGVLRIGKRVKDRMHQMTLHLPNSAISVSAGSTLISRTQTKIKNITICSESLIGRVESNTD